MDDRTDASSWRLTQALILLGLCIPMAAALAYHFDRNHFFLSAIYFGSDSRDPKPGERGPWPIELRELDVPAKSTDGYDGQFYAEIALDPLLDRNDVIAVLDSPRYRAGRIGLPVLAWLLGMGDPSRILHVYSLLNVAFWLLLVLTLFQCIGIRSWRDVLLAIGTTWAIGTIISVERSLTDLPAAVVSLWAIVAARSPWQSAGLVGLAALVKETSVLSAPAVVWPRAGERLSLRRLAIVSALVLVPIAAWTIYLRLRLSDPSLEGSFRFNFGPPLVGFVDKIQVEWTKLLKAIGEGRRYFIQEAIFELVGMASVAVQAAYLAKPRWQCPIWRWGVGFAIMTLFLAEPVWGEHRAFCRVLLPLTFAFNLLIHKERQGKSFLAWWLAGNCSVVLTLDLTARMIKYAV